MNGEMKKVVVGVVTAIIFAVLAWSATCNIQHGEAIAVLKTKYDAIIQRLDEQSQVLHEIRSDQIRRERRETHSGQR